MEFLNNSSTVLKRAWSVRLALLGAVFSAAEVALPHFAPFLPDNVFAVLAGVASAGAIIARVVAQPKSLP